MNVDEQRRCENGGVEERERAKRKCEVRIYGLREEGGSAWISLEGKSMIQKAWLLHHCGAVGDQMGFVIHVWGEWCHIIDGWGNGDTSWDRHHYGCSLAKQQKT